MASIKISNLQDDLPYGARISGVTQDSLKDAEVRTELLDAFENYGLLVFQNVESTAQMQVDLSNIFGPLRDSPSLAFTLVDDKPPRGVIEIKHNPERSSIFEVNGKRLIAHLPWHFDQCYNDTLNRGGVLRAIVIPPEGGITGYADGIQLYRDMSPDLIKQIEGCKVMYRNDLIQDHIRFGRPKQFRELRVQESFHELYKKVMSLPMAIHPAVWTRKSGEKIFHACPWFAEGIEGRMNPEGDKLLEAVFQDMFAKMKPYYHRWTPTDMLVWDNWRMLHNSSGCPPEYPRIMHRTTIEGDYGLGSFEGNRQGDALLEMNV